MIYRSFRYKMKPTQSQSETMTQFVGVVRLVYNIAFEQRRDWWRQYQANAGKIISYPGQARELADLRKEIDWIAAVSRTSLEQALRDLDAAYTNFFRGRAAYPSPRKKGINDSFRVQGREASLRKLNSKWSAVRLPKIGWVKFRDSCDRRGRLMNLTVSLSANGWHVAFIYGIEHTAQAAVGPSVGIDRGVTNTLALSTGEMLSVPDMKALDKRTRRAQRVLSRRKRGSRRYAKQRQRVARLKSKAARIRADWHHRASLDIAKRFGVVVLEDLKTANMTRSAKGTIDAPGRGVRQKAGLNRAILAQGWHGFEVKLAYKLEERGGHLCKVPAAYTSQTCSACGAVDKGSRESQAIFACVHCGHRAHADTNAAINILRRNTASMIVEEGHWLSDEAITGIAASLPQENLSQV